MEDSYLSILSTVNMELVSSSAKLLEESSIPFIAESVELQLNGTWKQGVRVCVPSLRSELAHQILRRHALTITNSIETVRPSFKDSSSNNNGLDTVSAN